MILLPSLCMPRAATRSSSSVWLLGDRRSSVSAPSWRRARASGGPQPLLESGPYKLVDHKLDIRFSLAAHDPYWGGRPPFDGIEQRIIPKLSPRLNGLLASERTRKRDVLSET